MRRSLRTTTAGAAAALLATAASGGVIGRAAADPQHYTTAVVGAYGGEPTIASDPNGVLYDTTPSGGLLLYRSADGGVTWSKTTTADPNSGDSCVTTDQSAAVYECNLWGSTESAPLQTDVWKSTDSGKTWTAGKSATTGDASTCGNSCQPFGVDRQWTTAWIPPGGTTKNAQVVIMYHDFYGPSQIWVNVSTDGGATYGQPRPVLLNPAQTQAGVTGSATGLFYQECNTIPIGTQTVARGPHAGRLYVAWMAADALANTTGCDISQDQAFHDLWVAWSDDAGQTWTTQQAFDAGPGHDASSPFASLALDNAGNPYIGFVNNLNANPVTCTAESSAGTVQTDPSCEYDMYVVWSSDGGATWDGGGGLVPGSAATPYRVNAASDTGTHWYPAIAAGNPGQVDAAWLHTPEILPTGAAAPGKADPGGCAGPAAGGVPTYPATCDWNLFAAQSTDLTSAPDKATWSVTQVTTKPMHNGDICNLGIACVAPGSNRNLLDFISETIDPTTGCAHIAYPDDNDHNALMVANQNAGCLVLAPAINAPEAPFTVLLLLTAVPVGAVLVRRRSRRMRTAAA